MYVFVKEHFIKQANPTLSKSMCMFYIYRAMDHIYIYIFIYIYMYIYIVSIVYTPVN